MRLADILYPPRCPGCDEVMNPEERRDGFCVVCRKKVIRATEPCCKCCGKPLFETSSEYCRDCDNKRHIFSQGRAIYVYEGILRDAMYRFKYSNRRAYAISFAMDAKREHKAWVEAMGIELIVPVPMFWAKERQRGYNQAVVLAKALGREFGIPVETRAVRRTENTKPQKELNISERRQNLKNAFNISRNVVKSKKILLVDDIYTTGATLDAVSGTLIASGAYSVCGMYACIGKIDQ